MIDDIELQRLRHPAKQGNKLLTPLLLDEIEQLLTKNKRMERALRVAANRFTDARYSCIWSDAADECLQAVGETKARRAGG